MESKKTRTTARATAGKPPVRLGVENSVATSSNPVTPLEAVVNERRNLYPNSISGRSNRTIISTRSNRSVSRTVRRSEIDLLTEEQIGLLEEKYETHEKEIDQMDLEISRMMENIQVLIQQSDNTEEGTNVNQQMDEQQTALRDKRNEAQKQRIELRFELKTLERRKAQLRREADHRKQVVEEEDEESDSQSQQLSQSDEEENVFEEDPDLRRERLELESTLDQEQQLSRETERLLQQLEVKMKIAISKFANEKAAAAVRNPPVLNLDDDELLVRLRNLQDPTHTTKNTDERYEQAGTVSEFTPLSNDPNAENLSTNTLSDQFAQVISRAFDKLGASGSGSTNNTERFLARQVQGKDLPVFTGRPEEWSTFITAFENSTQGCGFNNMDNLPRLQKSIKKDALKTIQCLLVRPENVPVIIQKLRMRFRRPEHIVHALIIRAKEVPAFREDRLDLLIEFGLAVDNLVETIKALNCTDHLTSPQLLEEFSKKLPVSLRTKWIEYVNADPLRKENLENFSKWMSSQTEIACKLCPPRIKDDHHPAKQWNDKKPRRRDEQVWAVTDHDSSRKPETLKTNQCLFCDAKGHNMFKCRKFEKEDVDERWKFVKSRRLCFGCLRLGHSSQDCRGKRECGQNGCKANHHNLLHKDKQQQQPRSPLKEKSVDTQTMGHAHVINRINVMILPVQIKGPKGSLKTFAMLDPGATITVIDEKVAEQLGLQGERRPFIHCGLHPRMEEKDSRSVNLEILNNSGSKAFQLKNVRTTKQLSLPVQSVRKSLLKKWNHLNGLEIDCYDQGKPSILIGLDNYNLSTTLELRKGFRNAPAAGRTELGWVLMGRVDEINRTDFCGTIFEDPDDELHQLVKQHFTTEAFGVKVTNNNPRSKEDILAQEIMDRTIQRVGDCWESGLLWKAREIELPNTKQLAMTRLLQMERKMDRNPEFAQQYIKKIDEYKDKGFARVLSPQEANIEGPRTFYLPHFMAINPKKPKKLRFVFDAAAKTNGVSLNDKLLKGPDKLTSLPAVLLKFRQRKIGITADIKDMFHRVKVRKEDADSQRFLWRGLDRNRDPDVMEMGVLIFGAACSPALAQEVKNLNAAEFQEQYPKAVQAITERHYVDDYLDSVDTVEEAVKMFQEVRNIHLKGSFDICNWISSSKELLSAIPKQLHAAGVKNLDLDGEAERVLGLFWKTEPDLFTFSITFLKTKVETLNQQRLPTKRELLALVMSIYDPLGFISILTVKAKMILQETWRTGIGWDDEIPIQLSEKWEIWNDELKKIDTFQLKRCYDPDFTTANEIELHVFVDASEQAFGAVAYFIIKKGDSIQVSFVMSKAKVAPTKHLSISRLELQAAVLGTRLANFIKAEHDIKVNRTIYWSDSRTVLCWIRADGKRFQQFVSCRIGELLESSEASEWRWVPTKQNVADEMTRDCQRSNWDQDSRWINGPMFLRLPEDQWPQEPVTSPVPTEELELRKEFICFAIQETSIIDLSRFSSYSRVVRTIAYVLRFILKCRKTNNCQKSGELIPEEMVHAEQCLWKLSQGDSFRGEIKCLTNKKPLQRNSRLLNLNVFLEEDGILRVHGRLDNAKLPQYTRRPVVLDPKHRLTRLLISRVHQMSGHNGKEKVVNELRQQFYIPQVRTAVGRAWIDCQFCKIKRAQPHVPLMGQLPDIRLESHVNPFKNVGLDYFGPVSVTIGRRHEKRWIALFTCLSTRAVHLELVSSLSTDSCLMAIRRFTGRRGNPSNIFSDNGTNFVGAHNEMKKALEEFNQQQLIRECTQRGILWHFIPPKAPHMGGSWERMVKAVKVALNAVLKEGHPKEEILRTLLVEAEHTVNCHPLTHVSVDPDDPEALTPNHFLIGKSSNNQVPGYFQQSDLCLRKQWRHAQQLANNFWRRWVREYLPTLLRRRKWTQSIEPIQLGDVVLVVDDQFTRNSWPLGRVVKLYPGKDGVVRVVDVQQVSGTYRRPVSKICKLDVNKNAKEEDKDKIDLMHNDDF